MRIAIIAQEEPVFFGPFLRAVIASRAADIKLVILAGSRGAGNHPQSLRERLQHAYLLWLLLEPPGFFISLGRQVAFEVIKAFGLLGSAADRWSVEGEARRYQIPMMHTLEVNAQPIVDRIRQEGIDVVINQTEIILQKCLLSAPRWGVVNRHASLLPRFRGRLGSFWGHACEPAEYGVTIHRVEQELDRGAIVIQKSFPCDPRWSYFRVLQYLFRESLSLMLEALHHLEDPFFQPRPQAHSEILVCRFPSLADVRKYRQLLKSRRKLCSSLV
jgi:folate-dependent phosphoribosylglycinamide formyltransferase PurN